MRVFVDTSAFYALVSATDEFHDRAREIYKDILTKGFELLTSSYVLVETFALIQNRLGFPVLKEFVESIEGIFSIYWVDEKLHKEAWQLLKERQKVSFVDCSSFLIAEETGATIFAFDPDFKTQGFKVLE